MAALGKTLLASTLAFGTMMSGAWSGGDWQKQNNNSYHKDSKAQHASYDYEKRSEREDKFYSLKWEQRKQLCTDDSYWNDWAWYFGDNKRDKYCYEFQSHPGYYGHKDHKDGKWGDKHGKKYGHDNDRRFVAVYNKDEHLSAAYSAKTSEHEKQASSVEYTSSNYNDYGRHQDSGWKGKDHSNWSGGYTNDETSYKASQASEKSAEASVAAAVDQRTVVNNYVSVYGDNNVVHNNVAVTNTAAVEQKASASEVNTASVEYSSSSDEGYNKGHDGWKGGYGEHGNSSSDVSYKASEYSEKSSSSEVAYTTSYSLNESYSQAEDKGGYDKGHDYSYKHDKCDPCKEDCKDYCEDEYKDDCYEEQNDDCYDRI